VHQLEIKVLDTASLFGVKSTNFTQTLTSIYETTHCQNTYVSGKPDGQKINLQRTYLGSSFSTKNKVGFNRTAIPLLFHIILHTIKALIVSQDEPLYSFTSFAPLSISL